MTFVLNPDKVYVVIHLHAGVIFNTAVFSDPIDANIYYHELRVNADHEYDDIDLQECELL